MARVSAKAAACVVLEDGSRLHLGEEIKRGGEGTVFRLPALAGYCVKLYHRPVNAAKARKLECMVRLANPTLLKNAAWPVQRAFNRRGDVVGFLMTEIQGHLPLHLLYTPLSRKQHFPKGDWKFLLRAAANLAIAFAIVHECGCVIGDANQGNALVNTETGRCMLIDCDSFQIPDGAQVHRCEVGVGHFTPPELQGRGQFAQHLRTADHDAFGLAMIVFHLLFFGRHPFMGISLEERDVALEEQIQQCRFAYTQRADNSRAPPGTASLAVLDAQTAELFEQAFSADHIGRRPAAVEWVRALQRLENSLQRCAAESAHLYARHLAHCPWCALEQQTGSLLFVSKSTDAPLPEHFFNVEVLKRQVQPRLRWSSASMCAGNYCRQHRTFIPPARRVQYEALERQRAVLEQQGKAKRSELRRLWQDYQQLADLYRMKIAALTADAERVALARELPKMHVGICPGVGVTLLARLRRFGVSSLAKVTRGQLLAVPGLSTKTIDSLLRQRADMEMQVRSEALDSVAPGSLHIANREARVKKAALEKQLRLGVEELIRLQHLYSALNAHFAAIVGEMPVPEATSSIFDHSLPST